MSELKAFRIIQGDTGGYGAPSYKCDADGNRIEEWSDVCEVYDKSEADKVFAELKVKLKVQTSSAEEAWKLKDAYHTSYAESVKELYEKNKELCHHKYKRCLAMAKWCLSKCSFLCSKCDFYCRWYQRWLELAKKFKEDK